MHRAAIPAKRLAAQQAAAAAAQVTTGSESKPASKQASAEAEEGGETDEVDLQRRGDGQHSNIAAYRTWPRSSTQEVALQ